jgi:electron transfer flavoprotein alpha subunit
MKTLIIAEHNQQHLKASTLITLGAARQLDQEIDLLIAGDDIRSLCESAAHLDGVSRVLCLEDSSLAHLFSETLAPVIANMQEDYSHIFLGASSFGKDLAPRIAALCGVNQISDIIDIVNKNTYKRPIYAGNAIATVKNNARCQVVTVRTSAFDMPVEHQESPKAAICPLDIPVAPSSVSFVSQDVNTSDRPELGSAEIIISGGRALGSAENFSLIYQLADKLGAAVGGSRAAVDAGYIANDLQIGQTGQVVAPKLYVAVGISGAIQHLAGMKNSKIIVAINKDEDAPIFSVADYGLVADLFDVLPELTAKL